MDAVTVRDGQLFAEDVPLSTIAEPFGTPTYVDALEKGDLLAVRSAGAYGFVMSSNYNTRGRAAEVLVDGSAAHEVRRRETIEELFTGESLPPD